MVTAGLWHDLRHNDLHFTVSDTGWAKSAWGKIFGQWIAGAAIFVYDVRGKFKATELLPLLERYAITTFCCPPTIYRMLILADLDRFDFTEPPALHLGRGAAQPRGDPGLEGGDGPDDLRGVRPDRDRAAASGPSRRWRSSRAPWASRRRAGSSSSTTTTAGPSVYGQEGRIAIKTEPRPVGLFREYLGLGGGERAGVRRTAGTTRATRPTRTTTATSGSSAATTT